MSDKQQTDVRASIEWAWLNLDNCVIRDERNIATAIDYGKVEGEIPPGGKQMLDFAFNNRVGFTNLAVKVLCGDIQDDDETVQLEKKSIKDIEAVIKRFKTEA